MDAGCRVIFDMLWDAHQLMQKRYFKLRHDFFKPKTYVRMREVLVAVKDVNRDQQNNNKGGD